MRNRSFSFLAACLRDSRGTGVVELAVILPLMGLFLVNIVDVSSVVVRRIQMQKAVNSSLEMVVANPLTMDKSTGLPDVSTLHRQTASLADVSPEKVNVVMWLECDGEEAENYDDECDPHQVLARYVQVRIEDQFVPMFSISALGLKGETMRIASEGALRVQ